MLLDGTVTARGSHRRERTPDLAPRSTMSGGNETPAGSPLEGLPAGVCATAPGFAPSLNSDAQPKALESQRQRGQRGGHGAIVGAVVLVSGKGELPGGGECREVVGAHALTGRGSGGHHDAGDAGVDRRRRVQRTRVGGAARIGLG